MLRFYRVVLMWVMLLPIVVFAQEPEVAPLTVESGSLLSVDHTLEFTSLEGGDPGGMVIAFSPDGSVLATGLRDGSVRLWDVATGEALTSMSDERRGYIRGVVFSPDGSLLISANQGGRINFWDVSNGGVLLEISEYYGSYADIAFHPNGLHLVAITLDGKVLLWNLDAGTLLPIEPEPLVLHDTEETFLGVAYSADGEYLAVAGSNSVLLWNMAAESMNALSLRDVRFWGVTFSPDSQLLVGGGQSGSIAVWDVATRELVSEVDSSGVRDLAFNSDGSVLLAANADNQITSIATADWRVLGILQGIYPNYSDAVNGIAISPDDTQITTVSFLNMVNVLVPDMIALEDYTELGNVAYSERNWQGVIFNFEAYLTADGDPTADLYYKLGEAHRREENHDSAINNFTLSLELAPDNANAIFRRGFSKVSLGDLETALDDLDAAIELGFDDASLLNTVAWRLHLQAENELALPYVELSLSLNPSNEHALDTRGWVNLNLGNYDLAIADFEAAVDKGENYSLYGLGVLYHAMGDDVLAADYLQRYVDLSGRPDAEAVALLDELKATQAEAFMPGTVAEFPKTYEWHKGLNVSYPDDGWFIAADDVYIHLYENREDRTSGIAPTGMLIDIQILRGDFLGQSLVEILEAQTRPSDNGVTAERVVLGNYEFAIGGFDFFGIYNVFATVKAPDGRVLFIEAYTPRRDAEDTLFTDILSTLVFVE